MTRSIFDPTGGTSEHSGSAFTPPDADQISHLPDEFTNPKTSPPTGRVDFQPPAEKPGIEIAAENDGRLLIIRMSGKLHKSDYQHFVPTVEEAVRKHGKVRMIVQMHDFHGWDAGAFWEDVKFDLKHFNHIERLAIVGETNWEKWMAAFCKPFTTAKIRYFPSEHAAESAHLDRSGVKFDRKCRFGYRLKSCSRRKDESKLSAGMSNLLGLAHLVQSQSAFLPTGTDRDQLDLVTGELLQHETMDAATFHKLIAGGQR